jgi:hypothetical protein
MPRKRKGPLPTVDEVREKLRRGGVNPDEVEESLRVFFEKHGARGMVLQATSTVRERRKTVKKMQELLAKRRPVFAATGSRHPVHVAVEREFDHLFDRLNEALDDQQIAETANTLVHQLPFNAHNFAAVYDSLHEKAGIEQLDLAVLMVATASPGDLTHRQAPTETFEHAVYRVRETIRQVVHRSR